MSPAPYGKSAFDRSRLEAAVSQQCLNNSQALTNYGLLDYQKIQASSLAYNLGAGIRSLDKQYMYGRICSSQSPFLSKDAINSITNTGRKSISRRKSSPCRLEFGSPIPLFACNNYTNVHKPKCQSTDDMFDIYSGLQAGETRQRACTRALSDCALPGTDVAMFGDNSQDDDVIVECSADEDRLTNKSQDSNKIPNGNTTIYSGNSKQESLFSPSMTATKSSPVLVGAAKRKGKPSMDPGAAPMSTNDQNQQKRQMQQQQQQHQQQQQQQQQQNLLMMASQQGMSQEQLQHALQQHHQGLPPSLQQLLQQQSTAMHHVQQQKVHEQLLHSLNEQLQMNLMHQAQILKDPTGTGSKWAGASINNQSLQALLMQHQQIMQQIQLVQRQFVLASALQPFGLHQGMMSPMELQQLWKEVSLQGSVDDSVLKIKGLFSGTATSHGSNSLTTSNGMSNKLSMLPSYFNGELDTFSLAGMKLDPVVAMLKTSSPSTSSSKDVAVNGSSSSIFHPLYVNKCCKWPNCEAQLDEFSSFIKHLNTEHQLDDRSTAQSRVQMEVVSSLESQLAFQKKVLKAMTDHLHQQSQNPPPAQPISQSQATTASMIAQHSSSMSSLSSQLSPKTSHDMKPDNFIPHLLAKPHALLNQTLFTGFLPPVSMVSSPMMPMPPSHRPPPLVSTPGSHGSGSCSSLPHTPTRDSCSSSGSSRSGSECSGPVRRRVSDKCNLPISAEIHRNREFYKNTDVRPPFTYASLIRQAIIESPHRQLTLNEIYQWFQNTFAYFRRNEATWKNAVRHNLSLHKCFMRVENVKGAVWTVDEIEFYKRRPQKLGGSPGFEDDYGSFWMIDDFEFIRRRQFNRGRPRELKNSLADVSYNETLSASLRAVLGEGMAMIGADILPDQESAQDLSMKATVHDGFGNGEFDEAELMMRIKQEVQDVYPDLDFSNPRQPSPGNSFSPQQDDHDPKGIEVKGGQMVMMPDVMDHYDSRQSMVEVDKKKKDAETEDSTTDMCPEYDEDCSREQEEKQHFEDGDDDDECDVNRSRCETEPEHTLRTVHEKFQHEQEDLKKDYCGLENGLKSLGERKFNAHQHYMMMPPSFSPLSTTDKEQRQFTKNQNFLARSISHEYGEERVPSQHGHLDTSFFTVDNQNNKNMDVQENDTNDAVGHRPDNSMTRPFVVQLPDTGPVFASSHRQNVTCQPPSIDIAVSGSS